MSNSSLIVMLVLSLFTTLVFGADTYVFNPFTQKLDNIGNKSVYDSYSTLIKSKQNTFSNPSSSSRYPLFSPSSQNYQWQRPLTACVDIFDGATGTTGATGATGATGKNALFCNISAVVRTIEYDSSTTGLNPAPAMQPFSVQLWHGATRIIAQAWTWWTGGSGNHIYGASTSSTFTPSVYSQYSGHTANNYVGVQVRYSSAATGKQYCTTGTPISVTKQGTQGIQGLPGQNASVDWTSVAGAISTINNLFMYFQETSANTFKLKFKDSNGFERFGITGSGKLTHMDTAGTVRFLYDPVSHSMTVYSGSGTAIFKTFSAHRTQFYNRHGGAAMTIYSSGTVVIGG